MSRLLPAAFVIVSVLSLHTANAALINIINDQTSAYAQVTYNPGAVLNPGTTIDSFSGALFPGAVFSGYNLIGDRSATLPYDTVSGMASSSAKDGFVGEGYWFFTSVYGGAQYEATGYASAAVDLNLSFQVTEGNSSMYMSTSNEGATASSLSLYDETLDILIEGLNQNGSWGYNVAYDVPLYDNHIYSLTGNLYAYTDLRGDPQGYFGFKFNDKLAMSRVPEPSTLTILMLALMGLACKVFRKNS